MTQQASAPAGSTAPATPPGPQPCPATELGLHDATTCTLNGIPATFATRPNPIKLKALRARVVGLRQDASLSDSSGVASATAHGRFVIVTLAITNTGDSPQQFETPGTNAAELLITDKQYSESFDAENGADQQSFISNDTTPIQPGETRTGDVVFDVPTQAAAEVGRPFSAVVVVGFGEDVSGTPTELGVIRFA